MKQTHGNCGVAGSHQAYYPLKVHGLSESDIQQKQRDVGNLMIFVRSGPHNPHQSICVRTKIYTHLGRNKEGLCQIQDKTQLKMKSDAHAPCDQDLILQILGMEDVIYVQEHRKCPEVYVGRHWSLELGKRQGSVARLKGRTPTGKRVGPRTGPTKRTPGTCDGKDEMIHEGTHPSDLETPSTCPDEDL